MFLQVFSRNCFASDKIKRTNDEDLYHLIFLSDHQKYSLFFKRDGLAPLMSINLWGGLFQSVNQGGGNFWNLGSDYWLMVFGKKISLISAADIGRSEDVEGYEGYLVDIKERRICSCYIPKVTRDVVAKSNQSGRFSDVLRALFHCEQGKNFNLQEGSQKIEEFLKSSDMNCDLGQSIRSELIELGIPYILCTRNKDRTSWIRLSVNRQAEIFDVARPATSLWSANVQYLDDELKFIRERSGLNVDGSTVTHLRKVNEQAMNAVTGVKNGSIGTGNAKNQILGSCELVGKFITRCKIG